MQQRGERRPLLMVFDSREGYYLELTTLCSYLLIGICLYLIQMGMVAAWSGQTLSIDPYKDGKGHHSGPVWFLSLILKFLSHRMFEHMHGVLNID